MIIQHLRDTLLPILPRTYIGEPPSHTDECISIRPWNGQINTEYFGEFSPTSYPFVLFVFRSRTYQIAADWAEVVKQKFNRYSDDKIAGMFMRGNVLYLGKSEEHLHEFQIIFKTIIKE